jgi:hypothetical protein
VDAGQTATKLEIVGPQLLGLYLSLVAYSLYLFSLILIQRITMHRFGAKTAREAVLYFSATKPFIDDNSYSSRKIADFFFESIGMKKEICYDCATF